MPIQLAPLDRPPLQADLLATHEAIHPYVHRTPILTCSSLDALSGARLYFKCENFQRIGAFKMRGAASAALRLMEGERERGLATHSSGNHAQAVARMAAELDIPAHIVMPHDAPRVKIAAVKGYGARVTFCENTSADRQSALDKVVARTGAAFIHPFDDYGVVAGQATASMELIEDTRAALDHVVTPVGGGGLLAGATLATAYFSVRATAVGAEPKAVDDAQRSLASGRIETNESNITVADGLRTHLGERPFRILHNRVDRVFTVSEEAIIAAMRLIWERMNIVVEASCAVPLAVILDQKEFFAGKNVGIVLTGGNVDLDRLPFSAVDRKP